MKKLPFSAPSQEIKEGLRTFLITREMKHYLLTLAGVVACVLSALSQTIYPIHLNSGTITSESLIPANEFGNNAQGAARSGSNDVLLLQFENLPASFVQQMPLYEAGIIIHAFIPDHTYLASVPADVDLAALGVVSYAYFEGQHKLSAELAFSALPESEDASIDLVLYPYPGESAQLLYLSLLGDGYSNLTVTGGGVQVSVPIISMLALAEHRLVMFLERVPPAPEPESIPGRAQHRGNTLSKGPGHGFDGAGVVVAVADDGTVSHEDQRGRITQHLSTNIGNHGDMVTGIATGAGNINPLAMGAAPGAMLHLYSIDGYPHIEQAPQNYTELGTSITITSYSESAGGTYTVSAQNMDGQAIEHPKIMHVLSAGNNSGDAASSIYTGIVYSDGTRPCNITGGRKASKSAIAVGNVHDNDEIRASSSRGPAADGRIKPDICSHGQGQLSTNTNNTYQYGGGTSAAAPGVGGGLATLAHVYKSVHNGQDPDAGLMKASLLNAADDLGRAGPDFVYGWGRMNLKRAAATLQNNQHLFGAVAHGGQQNHIINIPANVKEVRIMTYWVDVPASPLAAKALVNDLDTRLISASNQAWFPWTLSAFPHRDSLQKTAWRGADHLNNMEQITLNNPVAGNYTLRVNGFLVPQGPQQYYVVYSFVTKDLEITYPVGGEGFVPGETEIIRWDATSAGQTGFFSLQYSVDSMATWQSIATNIPATARQHSWVVPNTVSGKVFIRASRGTQAAVSPAALTIIGLPNFHVQHLTNSTASVTWQAVPGATSYEIYTLGDKYMSPVGVSTSTNFTVNIASGESKWYSVAAKANASTTGRRAYAQKYLHTACDVPVTLTLKFDLYPAETRWEIVNNSGVVIAFGGPYIGQTPNSTLTIQQCLSTGCYELVVFDSYGDGICCNRGNGFYTLTDPAGNVLAAGGQFGGADVKPFCVSPTNPPLALEVIATEPVSCKGGQDGSISVAASGGTGSYSYTWNTGITGPNLGNLSIGTYTVTVSDGNSQTQLSVTISEPAAISAVLATTHIPCSGSSALVTSTITGGMAPYSYSWSNGDNTASATVFAAGTYTLTVTDTNGCTKSASKSVQQLTTGATISLIPAHVNCHGQQTGAIACSLSGGTAPYTYHWSTGATTAGLSNVGAGTYQVTVTDANGCTSNSSTTILQPVALELQLFPESVSCYGGNDGVIFSTTTGGVLPYSYTWNTGATLGWAEDLTAGAYSLTVTDSKGCTVQKSAGVAQPQVLEVSASAINTSNGNNGSVHLEVDGGTMPYTYVWSNGASSQTISGLAPGIYAATVTDANDCTVTTSATVLNGQVVAPSYCVARASNTNYEWIQKIQIGAYSNTSGNNGGYGNFVANPAIALTAGTSYAVTLTPGFQNNPFNESWRIWVDLNQDGDFYDAGENIVALPLTNQIANTTLIIPNTALSGTTRMRISMKYGSPSAPCGTYAYGEVEDYTVTITSGNGELMMAAGDAIAANDYTPQTTLQDPASIEQVIAVANGNSIGVPEMTLFPNPASGQITCTHFSTFEGAGVLSIFDAQGRLLRTQPVILQATENRFTLLLDGLASGYYHFQLQCEAYTMMKPFTVFGQ